MRPFAITDDIHWVGAVDWNSRDFHGYSRSPLGTTYNAFHIRDEKTALIDTVKASHAVEFVCALSGLMAGRKLDYMVVNHLEQDHSGVLVDIVERYRPEKIFCSAMGERSMRAIYPCSRDWPVHPVKSGESVSLGRHTLQFVETRMLHWPDNMVTYVPEARLLISSDAFGQNWATAERYSDEVDRDVLDRQIKEYYANIVQPYAPMVLKTLAALRKLNLDVDILAPDHGLIHRGADVARVLDLYERMAEAKPAMRAVIAYDTMWHSTELMAEAIADGLLAEGVPARLMFLKANHHSAVMTELLDAGALLMGSPTHNNGILPHVAGMLQYMKGLRPQNKVAGAFGSFGWSGESVAVIGQWLKDMKMDVVEPAPKVQFVPGEEALNGCYEYGRTVALALKEKLARAG